MTDKELKRLSRAELLEMLLLQSKRVEVLEKQVKTLEEKLADRRIMLAETGSIAEASLLLNGIFEDAQKAADQYLENTKYKCAEMENETKRKCLELLHLAKQKGKNSGLQE